MKNYVIMYYDLNYEIITCFDNYEECATWFHTSVKSIHSYIHRSKREPNRKIRDKDNGTWGYLVKVKID